MVNSIQRMAFATALGVTVVVGGGFASTVHAAGVKTAVTAESLPKFKQTSAGLYVTSKEAAAAMAADEGAVFLDVRTIPEVVFVGAPENAYNVPYAKFVTLTGTPGLKSSHKMVANPDFAAAVDGLMARLGKDKSTALFVMCRSGGRSAGAVNVLHGLGYSNVYSVVDGFEGGSDKAGQRTVSGWKNSGLPWTYKLTKARAYRVPAK